MGRLTYDERCIVQHTLGLNRSNVAYRNYFSAEAGHSDMPVLDALVAKGLMVREHGALSPGFIFHVTREGKQALNEDTAP